MEIAVGHMNHLKFAECHWTCVLNLVWMMGCIWSEESLTHSSNKTPQVEQVRVGQGSAVWLCPLETNNDLKCVTLSKVIMLIG